MANWKVVGGLAGLSLIGVGAAACFYCIGYKQGKRSISRPVGKSYAQADTSLTRYINEHNHEDPVLAELRQVSLQHSAGRMTSSLETGRLLTVLCTSLGATKVIDVGLFTGCSSYSMAKGMKDGGRVIACDINSNYADIGRPFWVQGGVAEKIEVRLKPALDTIQELLDAGEGETFDMMFIDAFKKDYPNYFKKGMSLLRSGGMIVVDNALWHGAVADPASNNEDTNAIREINRLMSEDERVEFVLMNIADGLGIAVKK